LLHKFSRKRNSGGGRKGGKGRNPAKGDAWFLTEKRELLRGTSTYRHKGPASEGIGKADEGIRGERPYLGLNRDGRGEGKKEAGRLQVAECSRSKGNAHTVKENNDLL